MLASLATCQNWKKKNTLSLTSLFFWVNFFSKLQKLSEFKVLSSPNVSSFFFKKIPEITRFFPKFRMLNYFLGIKFYCQIWLNHIRDDHHFSYTKKKTLLLLLLFLPPSVNLTNFGKISSKFYIKKLELLLLLIYIYIYILYPTLTYCQRWEYIIFKFLP
jgi:hypothetical protein